MRRVVVNPRRLLGCLLLAAGAGILFSASRQTAPQPSHDWTQFGYDVSGSGVYPLPTGIPETAVASLHRRQVRLDGTADSSPIYLHAVPVKGSPHDVFFLTTTYGKTIAIDANSAAILWEYTPPSYHALAGTYRITNSTPAADPDRTAIYAAAPDGAIRKLAVADGRVLWTTPITLLPQREKIASPLRYFRGRIVAVTDGYIGDQPPYQGHVAILDAASGRLLHVWNSLCSNRTGLLAPASCSSVRSGIWGRSAPVIDPATGHIFVATGNGPFNGATDWGDSIVELDSNAAFVRSYTPADHKLLDDRDLDLGSTAPALLGGGILAQGGKDSRIRLVSIPAMAGAGPHVDHELEVVPTPGRRMLFTALAVWPRGAETWLFAADNSATGAWVLRNGKLTPAWTAPNPGTSPVLAGGLLYVYNPRGGLSVYDPLRGTRLATLACGPGHWNSPIAADGRIALPEGNANLHATSGVFDIWSAAP